MATSDRQQMGNLFLDRFEIIKPLGMGLLGAVYRARDLNDPADTEGNVAIQLLRPGEKTTAIKDEAGILQRLREVEDKLNDGFHAAPKYIIGSADDPQPYIVLEFMRGTQVITLLRENEKGEVNAEGKLAEPVALDIARQLFRLLRILHEKIDKTYIDLRFENLWWDGKTLKVTDWNVLEDKTEDGVTRDLFRGSLYLYRMLTGVLPKLRSNMDVGALDAAPAWKDVTEGTQYLLSRALHTVPSRRFTKAEDVEEEIKRLLDWWCADINDLFGEANALMEETNVLSKRKSSSPFEEERLLNFYRDIRHIASIARQRMPMNDRRLEYLESELHDDLPKSIALFRGGSDQKALSLMEAAYPRAIDPAPIRWWIGLMQFFIQPAFKESVKNPKPLAELAADAAEKYAAKDFKVARSHFDIFVNEIKERKEMKEIGERELALLRDAIEAQEMVADALNENVADAGNVLKNVIEVINRAGELNPYLPDDFDETAKEQLEVGQRLVRDEQTIIQDTLSQGETLFADKKFYEAGQTWLEGLALHPENDVLLEKIREAIKHLLENKEYGQALNLIEQVPALTSHVNDLHALWHTACAELAKQELVVAQYAMLLVTLNQNDRNIREISDDELLALKEHAEKQRARLIESGWLSGDISKQFDELIQNLSDEINIRQLQKKIPPIREFIEKNEKLIPDLSDEKLDELLEQLEGYKKTAGEVADVDPALVGKIQGFGKKLEVAKAERQRRAALGDRARLIAELNGKSIVEAIETGRRYFAGFSETQIRALDISEKDLYKAIENAAKQFVPEKPELVDQFIAVFGKALRNESELRTAVLDREKKKWKDKFKPLHKSIAHNKIEEAFAEMERLVESDTPLHDDLVKVWRDEWSEVVVDILSLDSDKNHSQLQNIIKRIWATDEEHQQFWDFIQKAKAERTSDLAKLQQEHQDLLWKRLNAIIFKNDTEIINSQRDGNLTIERFEELLDEVLNLIAYFETNGSQSRASDPTLKTNAKRFESYQGTLTKAKELWTMARDEVDKERQRNILAELRRYKFSGWRLPGDFERELGLPEEKPVSKHVLPPVSVAEPVKVTTVSSDASITIGLKRKEVLKLKARAQTESNDLSKEDRAVIEKILALARVNPHEYRAREMRLLQGLPIHLLSNEFSKAQKSVDDMIARRDGAADYLRRLFGLPEQEAERQSDTLVTKYKLHTSFGVQPDEYKKKFMDDWRKAHQLKFDAK